jgi:hypothetical protein
MLALAVPALAFQLYCRCSCLGTETMVAVHACAECTLVAACVPAAGEACSPAGDESQFVEATCVSTS